MRFAHGQLRKAGFSIILGKEEFPWRRFYDVGALVYYLKAVPWVIPGFTPRKYFGSLNKLNGKIQRDGYIQDRNNRFVILAERPRS